MAGILITSTAGTSDPTLASLPFVAAMGAVQAGHEPTVALLGEATFVMKDYLAEQINGVGWPPLTELLQFAIDNSVPIYV